ncbi:hypothetical protein HU727_004200 [Pseudomonas sp. SWRI153]|uniref:Uncharacterized protein n=1 Tax=Pseudomonas khorasanensis TaxID=2745508 RepID=A0A923JCL0_9PSED|nr:hypothetical protein [Pseudomonas khorasanensis]MBV4484783.1 hypothetical protein [Pseudomonas khorasanensis]
MAVAIEQAPAERAHTAAIQMMDSQFQTRLCWIYHRKKYPGSANDASHFLVWKTLSGGNDSGFFAAAFPVGCGALIARSAMMAVAASLFITGTFQSDAAATNALPCSSMPNR